MATRSSIVLLLNGLLTTTDISADKLVVGSIQVGGGSGTELTKTILDSLIANSHASGSDNQDVVAGNGLTGGGTGATTTLNVGAGSGISVSADAVAVDSTVIRTNGANAFTADQSMGGFKLTGLAAPTANGDALRYDMLAANNGIATLDGGGKIPVSQLPNSVMEYKGNWDASSNTPTLADGTGNTGDVYRVNVAGTQNLGSGSQTFSIGDWAVYNGTIWQRSQNSDSVVSVNGDTGVVTVNAINQLTGDVTTSAASGSQSKAATIANDAITTIKILDANVTAAKLASDSVTTIKIVDSNVTTAKIADSNVTAAKLASDSVTTIKIVDANVTAAKLASDSVTTIKIVDANVTAAKLASDSVTTVKIVDANVTLAKLASDSVDENKIKSTSHDASLTGGSGAVLSVNYAPQMKKVMVAGEAFAANTSFLVRMALTGETAGRVYKADQTSAQANGKFHAIGIALSTSAVSAGQNITVTLLGSHTLGASDTAFNAGDVGLAVWLSSATGGFSITAPSTSGQACYKIGVVETTSGIFVQGIQLTGIA